MKLFKILTNVFLFSGGYLKYKMNGVTPKFGYFAMRKLYSLTNGKFNEVVAKSETMFRSKYDFKEVNGVLGNLTNGDIQRISNEIHENGYVVFPNKLSKEIVEKLILFARSSESVPRGEVNGQLKRYNSERPMSSIYDFKAQSLFEEGDIQTLLTDESVLAVAQEYLGPKPVLDLVAMWWSTANYENIDYSKAAQLFHFDMDRIKFLKFFIYLSDVDEHNGPHCYISKSNRYKPKELRRDGRILDDELHQHYSLEAFTEIKGPKGTILAVDTAGFHKGKPLEKGERLLFQMEFATSMFGQYYPPLVISDKMSREFIKKVKKYKCTFSEILREENK